jgi:hypothetical protein
VAQKFEILKTCDLSGVPGPKCPKTGEVETFELTDGDGQRWEVEACSIHGDAFRRSRDKLLAHARKVISPKAAPVRGSRSVHSGSLRGRAYDGMSKAERTVHNADLRTWAESVGLKVPARGRIPGDVLRAYDSRGPATSPNLAPLAAVADAPAVPAPRSARGKGKTSTAEVPFKPAAASRA